MDITMENALKVAPIAGRVLMNYITGRGFPGLVIHTSVAAVVTNVVLNFLWILHYGITGAAWASKISYAVSFLGSLLFLCRLSGNHWTKAVLPWRGECIIYWKVGKTLCE
jgi:Na+-driven multidrug efflux pump